MTRLDIVKQIEFVNKVVLDSGVFLNHSQSTILNENIIKNMVTDYLKKHNYSEDIFNFLVENEIIIDYSIESDYIYFTIWNAGCTKGIKMVYKK